jgi:predicted porin
MNKKLLAVAVSAAIMAPVASQAEVIVYGRINNALDITDVDGQDGTTDISGIVSRFGIKASADMGNGLEARGRYEFSTSSDKEQPGIGDIRIATVGISGGFGAIDVGNQWSAFYNAVGTNMDPTYTLGYYIYSSYAGGPYRESNAIKYSNSFGPIYLEIDGRLNDSEEGNDVAEKLSGNGGGIGIVWQATDNLSFGAAFDSEDAPGGIGDDTDRTGVTAKWDSGGWFAMVGWMETETGDFGTKDLSFYGGFDFSDATTLMVGYAGGTSDAADNDADQVFLGVYHSLGGGLKLWFEGTSVSYDAPGDLSRYLLGMRIDF